MRIKRAIRYVTIHYSAKGKKLGQKPYTFDLKDLKEPKAGFPRIAAVLGNDGEPCGIMIAIGEPVNAVVLEYEPVKPRRRPAGKK